MWKLTPPRAQFAQKPQYISYYLLGAVLAILCITSVVMSDQPSAENILLPLLLIIKESSPVVLLALGVGLIIAAGKIDISTASLAGLVAVVYGCSYQMESWKGWLVFASIAIIPATHAVVSGLTIAYRKGPSLIITWALGIIYTSIAGIIAFFATSAERGEGAFIGTSTSISLVIGSKQMVQPTDWQSFEGIARIISWVVFSITIIWVSQIDRICRAIGAARRTSRYIGIDERRSLVLAFFLVGVFASIAGMLHASFSRSASVGDMAGKELTAVAVAVLGGTVLSGGYFSARGIIAAGLVYQTLVYLTRLVQAPFLQSVETRIIEVVFAIMLLGIGTVFGKLMSGDTEVIVVKAREQ